MKKMLLATALAAVLASPAYAAPLALVPVTDNSLGAQSTVTGCIIAGTNCGSQNPLLGYNEFAPNNASSYNRYSTQQAPGAGVNVAEGVEGTPYTAGLLVNAAGGVIFDIGIDVNTTAAKSEELVLFELINKDTNTVLFSYSDPDGTPIAVHQNGNGYGDFLLTGINLVGLGLTTASNLIFHAVWTGAVDGVESFFLANGRGGTVQCPQPPCGINPEVIVPGPIAGAGLFPLLGLAGFGFWAWRRRPEETV